ncbi:MAG: extracellular solute-binding protein [Chloroflexi bacterium]|nr:extracellular solute-binding protein [Chloroflexota bacterium]
MLTRRHFLTRSLGSAAILMLSACAPSAPAQPSGSSSAPTQQPAAPASTAAPSGVSGAPAPTMAPSSAGSAQYKLDLGGYRGPAPTGTAIKLRTMRQSFNPAAEELIKGWNAEWSKAYPNVAIEEEVVPYGDLNQKLQTYVAAGDAPDIMMGKGDFVQAYVFNHIVLNLSEYLTDAFVNDIPASMRAQQSVDGKLYGMPWEQGHTLLYFNRDLFQKAGVQTPPETDDLTKGWSWDQAVDAWQKLTTALNPAGDGVFALGSSEYGNGGPGSSYWYEGDYIRSMGDPNAPKDSTAYKTFIGISPDGTTASGYVDTPEAVKGMTLYQSLFQKKLTPSVAVAKAYEDGKAATRFSSITLANRFANSAPSFKWGAAAIPRGTIVFNHTSGDAPIVYAKTKYPAEAVAYLGFLHNDKNRIGWATTWGSMPARQSLFDKIPGYNEYPRSLAVALTKAGYSPPVTPGYLEYFSAMNTAVKDIALGAPVEDRLHKVAKEIDGLLAPYKR